MMKKYGRMEGNNKAFSVCVDCGLRWIIMAKHAPSLWRRQQVFRYTHRLPAYRGEIISRRNEERENLQVSPFPFKSYVIREKNGKVVVFSVHFYQRFTFF